MPANYLKPCYLLFVIFFGFSTTPAVSKNPILGPLVNGPYSISDTSYGTHHWIGGNITVDSSGSVADSIGRLMIVTPSPRDLGRDYTLGSLTNNGLMYGTGSSPILIVKDAIGLINNGSVKAIQPIVIDSAHITSFINNGEISSNYVAGYVYTPAAVEIQRHTQGLNSGVTDFTNTGSITGAFSNGIAIYDNTDSPGQTPVFITNLNNYGIISGDSAVLFSRANVTTINNYGTMRGDTSLYFNAGSRATTINNYGRILGDTEAISFYNGSLLTTLNNSGAITSSSRAAVSVVQNSSISNIINSGTISNTSTVAGGDWSSAGDSGSTIYNGGQMLTLTNTGSIYTTAPGAFGIYNNLNTTLYDTAVGKIDVLNNSQGVGNDRGALTYTGTLPKNYSIIINGPSAFGQLAVTNGAGATTFGIYAGSTLSTATYSSVLTGVASSNIANYGSIFNIWNRYDDFYKWQLVQGANATTWDLQAVGLLNRSGARPLDQSSDLVGGITVAPIFDGGTLKVSNAGTITTPVFTITTNNDVIDQNGLASTFSGVISDNVSGAPGSITIANAGSGGSVTFIGANTYTGSTTINSGATLALLGNGAISQSSGVANNGNFDISATTAGATVNALTGSGAVALGSKSLTIANASGNFSGAVGGTGSLNITGGNQTLSGINTYSGGTQVQSGANLSIASGAALGSGTLALIGSATLPATLTTTATTAIANSITVSGDPVFDVASGTTTTISSPITNGASAGDVIAAGGGVLALTAVNTYTGSTTINSGATLALLGNGAISQSSGVANNGNFDISGKAANVSVATYTQNSSGTLVMNVSPTNTQKLMVTGSASLAGGFSLTGIAGTYSPGKYSLLTANNVSGTFGNLSSNLSSLTTLGYQLAYDAGNVYLVFTPNVADTQQSLVNTASALQNIYTLQNSVLANSFSYDCNEFGKNGVCISVGGRNTAVSAANGLNNTSGLLIAAYRPHQNYRIGAYVDQNLSVNNAGSTVSLGNNTPVIGLFGAWNERIDGTGTELKVSVAYGQKNATVTRQVVGTSEAGSGSSQLNSQGAQVTARYGFGVVENVIVAPYVGIRYTQNNMGGYTEGTSATVTSPLTYSALNTNATTALAGLDASYKFASQAGVFGSVGVETDTNTANGTYSATGINGLTPINFNANPVKTRPTATLGAYYDVAKNQRLGVTSIYRQEPFQAASTTTLMATYTIGM